MNNADMAIVEVYLNEWGKARRNGWKGAKGYPKIELCYSRVCPSKGEVIDSDYIEHTHRAIESIPGHLTKEIIYARYEHNATLKAITESLNTKYGRIRSALESGQGVVYGYLKGVGVIRG